MSDLKKHEVKVENKQGQEMTVSVSYYKQNKGKLKMIDDNGWKNKMDQVGVNNKAQSETNDNPDDKDGKAGEDKA